MNKTFVIIIATALCVSGILLVYASQTGTAQVFTPSELAAARNAPQRLRLIGRVLDKTINYRVEPDFRLAFAVGDPDGETDASRKVIYQGIKPDMFAPGRDVIIDGELRGQTVHASSLLTQCPSKYEAPDPESMSADNAYAENQY